MSHDHHDYRGYAGQVASGMLRPGDEVVVLPSGFTTTVAGIDTADGPVVEAFPPMSVTVRLADNLDVSRGDMLCRPNNMPDVTQDVDAMVCWFSERPLQAGATLAVKHTTRWSRARVQALPYRLDVNTLRREEGPAALAMNDIGRVSLRTANPLFVDEYRRNRTTGSFILVDEGTHETVGAGMILGTGTPS
jgi:bifunctional enzyme CysN/CysC